MLLTGFRKEIFRPECNPEFQSLHCIAHLDNDVGPALPYLNASLGGDAYFPDPPSVTFKIHGRLITVHAGHIAVNALKDEDEAERIISWLQREINQAWEERENITPSTEGRAAPQTFAILKLLPKTNCGQCGLATCMVFAVRLGEGSLGIGDCPPLSGESKEKLQDYLVEFPMQEAGW